jgi:hypothetical protein
MVEWPAEVAGKQALISLRLDHPRTAADEFAIPLAAGGWFPGVVNVYYSEDVQVRIE